MAFQAVAGRSDRERPRSPGRIAPRVPPYLRSAPRGPLDEGEPKHTPRVGVKK